MEFGLQKTSKATNENTVVERHQKLLAELPILWVLLVTRATGNTFFFIENLSLLSPILHLFHASLYYHQSDFSSCLQSFIKVLTASFSCSTAVTTSSANSNSVATPMQSLSDSTTISFSQLSAPLGRWVALSRSAQVIRRLSRLFSQSVLLYDLESRSEGNCTYFISKASPVPSFATIFSKNWPGERWVMPSQAWCIFYSNNLLWIALDGSEAALAYDTFQ